MFYRLAAIIALGIGAALAGASSMRHTFTLGVSEFQLDGKPFQVRSGEMHPERIPRPYWRHRIQMAKAMGLNTVALYTFWNAHESKEGVYDFESGNLDTAAFIKTCQEEGMFVLLRPGPYCCGEWDFGGIPPYLLKYPDLRIRSMDSRYIAAVEKYLKQLAKQVKPLQVTEGGPILMVQLENEYGSYSNDRVYIKWLHDTWRKLGISVPFYTSDGPTQYMLESGSYPGCAVGLDSGSSEDHWDLAAKINPGVPIMSGETYPGWLTHWGEKWAGNSAEGAANEVKWLMDHHKSFNLYVVHGGTNFGLTAGANSGGHGYEPDVTSYDYDAPVTEQGRATPKFDAIRSVIESALGSSLPPIPSQIPSTKLPEIQLKPVGGVVPVSAPVVESANPLTFETLGQNQGLVEYSTTLVGRRSGKLHIDGLHDFALVYLDDKFLGSLDRRQGVLTLDVPESSNPHPHLRILVEGMGHINFSSAMIDRKGIVSNVTLNGMIMTQWRMKLIDLASGPKVGESSTDKGGYFEGHFAVSTASDTFIDCSKFSKGYIWVNGHMLGRYWNIGPQTRLYCPAEWLHAGSNKVVVLDLIQNETATLSGYETLKD